MPRERWKNPSRNSSVDETKQCTKNFIGEVALVTREENPYEI
jgi:hypothetical protein